MVKSAQYLVWTLILVLPSTKEENQLARVDTRANCHY
jgi:hypothetical protein